MLTSIFKAISFTNLLALVKDKFLSFPSISEGVKYTAKLFTVLTDWEGDDIIYEMIEPEWSEINDYLKISKGKPTSDKVRFAGERLKALGERLVTNASRFDK